MTEIIQYSRELPTPLNLLALPKGTGAPYLECIRSHNGDLIAKAWRRKIPPKAEVVIAFG